MPEMTMKIVTDTISSSSVNPAHHTVKVHRQKGGIPALPAYSENETPASSVGKRVDRPSNVIAQASWIVGVQPRETVAGYLRPRKINHLASVKRDDRAAYKQVGRCRIAEGADITPRIGEGSVSQRLFDELVYFTLCQHPRGRILAIGAVQAHGERYELCHRQYRDRHQQHRDHHLDESETAISAQGTSCRCVHKFFSFPLSGETSNCRCHRPATSAWTRRVEG